MFSSDTAQATIFHMLCNSNLGINSLFLPVLILQPTGLYEYKLIGTLRAPPDLLADICMDLGYIRRQIPQVTGEQHIFLLKNQLEGRIYCYFI